MTSAPNQFKPLAKVRIWRKWESMLKTHWASETQISALMGVFVGLTLLLTLLSKSPVFMLIATLWLVVLLLVTAVAVPVLIIFCTKEWRVFKGMVALDPGLATHKWASGRLGKVLAFLRCRRVPYDPIRDGFVQIAGFFRKSRRKTDEGR